MDVPKYKAPERIELQNRQWPDSVIDRSPKWCSVDLRDGNQALPDPMDPEQKMEYFELLCQIGFKNIEVAFPSASKADFEFTHGLVADKKIPDDVFIMGLTQCRQHLIERTFEAFEGAPRAIVHAYLAPSDLHRSQVFGLSHEDTIKMAIDSTSQIRELAEASPDSDIRFEFSPEEFTDTDLGFSLEICEAVYETWGRASKEKPLIFNLPATVERRPPNHYADMIEWFCRKFSQRDNILVSVHAHNDQGMAVAATELAVLAGADRVEGTLFGHGERTGNVDLVTMALNLFARGIDIGLDFSNLDEIADTVQRLTGMPIYYRAPYAGEYAFTAFSGSHQDAINKGMHKLKDAPKIFGEAWKVPYLHIDPTDLGRKYEHLIRINSQSGKGGIAWVLEQDYGISIPKSMQPQLSKIVQEYSDDVAREVTAAEVYDIFTKEFLDPKGPYELLGYWPRPDDDDPAFIHGDIKVKVDGEERHVTANGNGPVSAFVHGMQKLTGRAFSVDDYHEQAIGSGEDAQAMAYVPLKMESGEIVYGVGSDSNIGQAAVRAIVAGLNRLSNAEQAD